MHFLAVMVLLMAGYTLKRNEHVRIDILSGRFGLRYGAGLDALGCLLVVVPLSLLMVIATWPLFWHAPVAIVGAILGSIFFGIATPTESGAVAAVAPLTYALAQRKLDAKSLRQAMDSTGILCSCIIFLLIGATCFTLVFRGFDGALWIDAAFARLPGGRLGFLVAINVFVYPPFALAPLQPAQRGAGQHPNLADLPRRRRNGSTGC